MNTRKNMIIIKGQIKTAEVRFCRYNAVKKMMDVEFNNGKRYSYAYSNVELLKEPRVLNPNLYRISRDGREFFDIEAIYVFKNGSGSYWHICFGDGTEKDYSENELNITETCLNQDQAKEVFEYIKQIAGLSNLKNEETGEKILAKRFEELSFVGNDTALAKYLNPSQLQKNPAVNEYRPIFPFGCNKSQYKAVKSAMENQISVIQGPPGTGKTQTILNIIANVLMQGKTVQIVSNNNAATENVYEKLSFSKYGLGFIAAALGSSKNKKAFINRQDAAYPDFSLWKLNEDPELLQKEIKEKSIQLKAVFDKQEELAVLKQEQRQLETEFEYFKRYVEETDVGTDIIEFRRKLSAKRWIALGQECRMISEEKQKIGFMFKLKGVLQYGILNRNFYKQDMAKIITVIQAMYYRARKAELAEKTAEIEEYLKNVNHSLMEELCSQSMAVLRDKLAGRYGGKEQRRIFDEEDLWKNPDKVLEEYPVILSTTFSSRNSLNTDVVYDYLIMDEASQVDICNRCIGSFVCKKCGYCRRYKAAAECCYGG